MKARNARGKATLRRFGDPNPPRRKPGEIRIAQPYGDNGMLRLTGLLGVRRWCGSSGR
jgi:hypothetical protein